MAKSKRKNLEPEPWTRALVPPDSTSTKKQKYPTLRESAVSPLIANSTNSHNSSWDKKLIMEKLIMAGAEVHHWASGQE